MDETAHSVKERPYIYQQYKIKHLFQPSSGTADGTMENLLKSFSEALNNDNVLPEYLLIIPDRDIILDINYFEPGTMYFIDQHLQWLARQFDRIITDRRERLRKICPGAVGEQPKIVKRWLDLYNDVNVS